MYILCPYELTNWLTNLLTDWLTDVWLWLTYWLQIESEPILIHVAVAENQRHPFEAILRSTVKHLSDAATSEFLFILDFFSSNARDTFNK